MGKDDREIRGGISVCVGEALRLVVQSKGSASLDGHLRVGWVERTEKGHLVITGTLIENGERVEITLGHG